MHPVNSDEEEDGYDSPHARRRGASVDEFLRGSELGRQVLYRKHKLCSACQENWFAGSNQISLKSNESHLNVCIIICIVGL